MTEKLFYADSHMVTFQAKVLACQHTGDFYEAVLDRTAFFPEGGGQYADTGVIDQVRVMDVQERDGIIYHTMEEKLEVGKTVTGELDWEERFLKMQHHTGEHIVSGLICERYGYSNVGFHLGRDAVTMDFNGPISREELKEIEEKANDIITQNIELEVLYPSREELGSIFYRSKMEIEGQVRIVRIPGVDSCACCAPHVKQTGEVGMIKLIGMQNYKGGVRISFVCGKDAWKDYDWKSEMIHQLSVFLSAREPDVYEEVERLRKELSEKKMQIEDLQMDLLSIKAKEYGNQEMAVLFERELPGNGARELANALMENGCTLAAVFVGNDGEGYRYVIGSRTVDTRGFAKTLNAAFQGRGGGKAEMVQGSLKGTEEAIRKGVEACRNQQLEDASGTI